MYEYGQKLIVTNDIDYTDEYDNKLSFKKGTFLLFVNIYQENTENEELQLAPFDDEYNTFYIPSSLAKQNIKDYLEYYQEQFSHLNPDHVYFGQLTDMSKFVMIENGEKVLYEKIGEYVTKEGTKYNAIRMPTFSSEHYWIMDNIDTYENKNFCYFEQDQKTDNNKGWDNDRFIPPLPLEVNDYFVKFPRMLDVLESCFKKESLSAELLDVYKNYREYKADMDNGWQHPESILITQVLEMVAEEREKLEHDRIMAEINRETEQFRQALIKKRFK